MVDAGDSKSPAERRAGSIPAPGTTFKAAQFSNVRPFFHFQSLMKYQLRRGTSNSFVNNSPFMQSRLQPLCPSCVQGQTPPLFCSISSTILTLQHGNRHHAEKQVYISTQSLCMTFDIFCMPQPKDSPAESATTSCQSAERLGVKDCNTSINTP